MPTRLLVLTLSVLVTAYGRGPVPVSAVASADAAACESLAALTSPTVMITTAQAVPAGDFTPPGATQRFANLPAFCRVAATLTPSPDSDIKIEVWMPSSNWNG